VEHADGEGERKINIFLPILTLAIQCEKARPYPYKRGYFEFGHCFIYLKRFKKYIKIHEYTFKFVK